jgi:hypothetical protein
MSITTSGTTLTFNDATTMTTASNVYLAAGTAMLFQQTAAPTGWTKVTTYNDYAIRIVSGTASTGGSVAFTTAFASKAVTGTNSGGAVSATSLSVSQLASHNHQYYINCAPGQGAMNNCYAGVGKCTSNTGGGASHSHGFTQPTFSGTAINLAVQYVDHIIATKN